MSASQKKPVSDQHRHWTAHQPQADRQDVRLGWVKRLGCAWKDEQLRMKLLGTARHAGRLVLLHHPWQAVQVLPQPSVALQACLLQGAVRGRTAADEPFNQDHGF